MRGRRQKKWKLSALCSPTRKNCFIPELTGSSASTVTPVVVCEGAEGRSLHKRLGEVEAGKTVLLSLAAK